MKLGSLNHHLAEFDISNHQVMVCNIWNHQVTVFDISNHQVMVCDISNHQVMVFDISNHQVTDCDISDHQVMVFDISNRPKFAQSPYSMDALYVGLVKLNAVVEAKCQPSGSPSLSVMPSDQPTSQTSSKPNVLSEQHA